jgi:hypothetical protein
MARAQSAHPAGRLTLPSPFGNMLGFTSDIQEVSMRKKTGWVLWCVLACAVPAMAQTGSKAAPAASGHEATEKALIANERKVADAVAKHDVKTFSSFVTQDGWSADGNGFMKVSDFTKAFDKLKVTEWHIADEKVSWIDDKSAIVIYTWTGKGTWDGQPVPQKVYASTVWTERNGKWLAVYHQESGATPPGK